MKKRIGVISIILENPKENQSKLNDIISSFNHIIKGRMGLPFSEEKISVISLTVKATMDDINSLTGKLGVLNDVQVKATVSSIELSD